MRILMNRTNLIACAALLLLATLAVLLINSAGGSSVAADADSRATPSAIPTASIDSEQVANFAALGGEKASWDSLPTGVALAVKNSTGANRFKLAGDQIRGVKTASGTHAWIVPGEGTICLAVDNADGISLGCGTTVEAIAGKLAVVQKSTVGGDDTVVGLAPDAASKVTEATSKNPASAVAQGNVYEIKGQNIGDLELERSSGATVGKVSLRN